MAIKLKRRTSGGALVPGTAPLATGAGGIQSAEPVYDAIADILYIGKGDDGSGNSTSISAVGGGGAFVKSSLIGAASGVASLDGTGKLPAAQLPASITGAMVYQGVWNASTNTPALASGTGTKGFFYKVSVAGTTSIDGNAVWSIGDSIVFDGTTWDKIDGPAEAVFSVAGRTGAITLTSADLTDATAAGKTLLTATSAAAQLSAIGGAPLASPTFTGTVTIPAGASISGFAPLASPTLTGTPAAPTATAGTNTTQIATTAFVATALAAFAPTGIDGGAI